MERHFLHAAEDAQQAGEHPAIERWMGEPTKVHLTPAKNVIDVVGMVAAVIVINLFLGWTFIGWVVALAMAVSGEEKKP